MENEFKKYATKHLGMSSTALESYMNITSSYISPTIIEERQLNVAQMDVFSRLMMDRIIFLGTQIDDYTANVIQAQLLYLDSSDPGKDISIYINSPGGSVYAGLGIYDTMQFIGAAGGWRERQTLLSDPLARINPSADERCARAGFRHGNCCTRGIEGEG